MLSQMHSRYTHMNHQHQQSIKTTQSTTTTTTTSASSLLQLGQRRPNVRNQTATTILLCLLVGVSVVFSEGLSSVSTKRSVGPCAYCHHRPPSSTLSHSTVSTSTSLFGMTTPRRHHVGSITSVVNAHLSSSSSSSSFSSLNLIRGGGGGLGRGADVSQSSSSASTTTSLFATKDGAEPTKCPFTKSMAIFGSLWGSFGVVYILAKAIKRVLPIALEPFGTANGSLVFTPLHWSLYTLSCLLFAYAEGYKGFHLKFAPLVVKRSFTLLIGTPQGNNPIHYILAPPYSMGLMYATKKRLITSWSVTLGVAAIVGIVKRLSPIPRCIIDAGVIVGLSLGTISILYHYIRSIVTGQLPNVDACLPDVSVKATSSTTPSKKGKND